MKKNVLLSAFMLFSAIASAQYTTWEDDFNDGDVTDWTMLDVDGNTSNWIARKNLKVDPNTGVPYDGTADILGTYNIDFTTLSYYPANENNWAIMPVQDLSFYTGTIQLILNAQIAEFGGNSQPMSVYVSSSPDMDSFLATEPIEINLARTNDVGTEFHEKVVDLSAYAGQQQVYIAIVKGGPQFWGVEIDDIKITAAEIAGAGEVQKTAAYIKQNPVAESLELQLPTNTVADAVKVKIYNTNGALVKEQKYNNAGISVGELTTGMYFVVLETGNTTQHLKFIKK